MRNNTFLHKYEKHLKCLRKLNKKESIRTLLSNYLGSSNNISFRNNTTSIIIDVFTSIILKDDYQIIYSDLEHPCIQNAIEQIFPIDKRVKYKFSDLLFKGKIVEIENNFIKDYNCKSIYFISHVLWSTGVVIDVEKIATSIKKNNKNHLVLVDGAQAVGNLKDISKQEINKTNINFYFGCTHKWLGTKNILGFVIVNDEILNMEICKNIFYKDIFSVFGGKMKKSELLIQDSTYDICAILTFNNQLQKSLKKRKVKNIITPSKIYEKVKVFPFPNNKKSNFYSVAAEYEILVEICDKLKISYFNIIKDENFKKDNLFLLRIVTKA